MSTEQQQRPQSEWMKAAYEAQALLSDEHTKVEVKTVDEILADHQAQYGIEIDDLEEQPDFEPDPLGMMVEWMDELAELAEEMPTQNNHYGWLVIDKVRNQLRDAYTEVKIYVQEQAQNEQYSCMGIQYNQPTRSNP